MVNYFDAIPTDAAPVRLWVDAGAVCERERESESGVRSATPNVDFTHENRRDHTTGTGDRQITTATAELYHAQSNPPRLL